MPDCGSQIILCDLPIRFDSYEGCTHNCSYCFVKRKVDISQVKIGESANSLKSFIGGARNKKTKWCDWDIPIHWGGMSDPFQPAEEKYRNSCKCLKVFEETQYPFVFSTKGRLVASHEYLDLIGRCNAVSQVSLVSPKYDKLEQGAPPFEERFRMLEKLAKNTKRLIVRISPYSTGLADEICSRLRGYKDSGVFGVEIEGMKRTTKRPGMVKVGIDWCYPVDVLRRDYQQIKDEAKRVGLAFYCGENRLRSMSDETCCCGVVGVDGFVPNRANLNRLVVGDEIKYSDAMRVDGSGSVFRLLAQNTIGISVIDKSTYEDMMELVKRSPVYLRAMGLM